jgi:UDP-glucuronate decarboxylase
MLKEKSCNLIDPILDEDIQNIFKALPDLEQLRGKHVFITGSTGLIGSQIVYLLAELNRLKNLEIMIIALARNEKKAQKMFGSLREYGVVIQIGDINQAFSIDETIDYIIHGASATSSRYFVSNPVETIITALAGTKNVLEFACHKKIKSMVYLSSLEVYGTPPQKETIQETDYGYIDPLSVRSSYSEGKRMAECLCASYAQEYGVPVKIARLSQTFGTGVEYDDGRVFAEFARCVVEKKNIILRTQGKTVRSYCYTADAVKGILCLLFRGVSGEAYNVTNMDTAISIRDMAQMLCDAFPDSGISVKIEIPEDIQAYGFNPEVIIRLDSGKLHQLGWQPSVGLEEMFRRMIQGWEYRYSL